MQDLCCIAIILAKVHFFFSEGQDIVIEGENPLKLTGYSSSMVTCRNTAGGEQDTLKWYGPNQNAIQSDYSPNSV